MRHVLGASLLVLFLAFTPVGQAQDIEDYVEITTNDGSTYVGQILSETDTEVRFRTGNGVEITIKVADIKSRKSIKGRDKVGGMMRLDPTASRLFFAATARPVPKHSAYVSSYELFFSFFATGVTEDFTMAGGLSLFPFSSTQLFYLAPKYTIYNKANRSFAVGALAGGLLGEKGMGGLLYGTGTLGPADKAVTAGAGFLFGNGEIVSTPIILIGAERQISSRLKLITENYVLPFGSTEVVLSGGLRIIGGSLTTDLAFFTLASILDEGGFPAMPWVSFTYNFDY